MIKHNKASHVPVKMSTNTNVCSHIHLFFLPTPLLLLMSPSSHHNIAHIPLVSLFLPPSSALMRACIFPYPSCLLSLPRSHHSHSQAPSLPVIVSPPPPSELHCECLVQQPQPLLQYAANAPSFPCAA